MYVCLGGKVADAMAAEDVYGCPCDKIVLRIEGDIFSAYALICYSAIERMFRFVFFGDGDLEFEVKVERKTDNVEAGANVG